MGNYGIKISQPGFDVKTCEDKDLIMSSKFNLLKTKSTGKIPSTVESVNHYLPYIPIFFTTREFTTPGHYSIIGDDLSYANSTIIFFTYITSYRYYIFYQRGI